MLLGVCGGVVNGTPLTKPTAELAAPMPCRFPGTRGGLLMTVVFIGVACDDWVATEDVLFDRVGEDGLIWLGCVRFVRGGGIDKGGGVAATGVDIDTIDEEEFR